MMRLITTLYCTLLTLVVCAGELSHAQGGKWDMVSLQGVDYVKMRDVCSFYRFAPCKGREGCLSYGAGNRVISVRPNRQDFYVNNFRYVLSYPVISTGGDLLISAIDMKKLVDPVLRPRFSTEAGVVKTVVIDPGHGGHDAGAVSAWVREKDCNLAVAHKLRKKLESLGYKVVMTREDDRFLTLQQRVNIANQIPNSIFISIHHNSGRSAATGIETFTLAPQGTTSPFARTRRYAELAGNNQDSENIALATSVHSRAIRNTGAIDRGIQRARFSVLCTIQRPAILFEGGFVSNAREGRLIASSDYQDKLAESICDGVVSYSAVIGRQQVRSTNKSSIGAARRGSDIRATSKNSTRLRSRGNYSGSSRM